MITHGCLVLSTVLYYGLLLHLPFWGAFVPCVALAHRIGILLHEYFHGIGLRRYRTSHAVVTLWDGIMMTFGMLEVIRGRHLLHHREVSTSATDDAPTHGKDPASSSPWSFWSAFDAVRHVSHLVDALRGRTACISSRHIGIGAGLSVASIAAWVAVGHGDVAWKALAVVAFTVLVPVSMRSAIEHQGEPGGTAFANEYRVFLPMFNANRHIHHHEDPTVPWYRLQWRTPAPLPASAYLTYWFRTYITRDLVRMPPMGKREARSHRAQREVR